MSRCSLSRQFRQSSRAPRSRRWSPSHPTRTAHVPDRTRNRPNLRISPEHLVSAGVIAWAQGDLDLQDAIRRCQIHDRRIGVRPDSAAGRYLLVVVAEGLDGRDFIVTARGMTDNEKRTFRAKGR